VVVRRELWEPLGRAIPAADHVWGLGVVGIPVVESADGGGGRGFGKSLVENLMLLHGAAPLPVRLLCG
jgi:hypothetical protein